MIDFRPLTFCTPEKFRSCIHLYNSINQMFFYSNHSFISKLGVASHLIAHQKKEKIGNMPTKILDSNETKVHLLLKIFVYGG